MTQAEFAKGWKLLILQPWGRAYRGLNEDGSLTDEARTQMDFYYTHLTFGHPEAWLKTAELYAAGESWPSLSAVRATLSTFHRRCVPALTDKSKTTDGIPMPEDIRQKLQESGILKDMPVN